MSKYIILNKNSCKNCYKCIRHCPVKSIRFSAEKANIIEDDCILCGKCYVVCPQNAKRIVSSLDYAKELVANNKVIASIAPSFVAEYDGKTIASMQRALKALGFYEVLETAVGATVTKNEYERILAEEKPAILISSCCPSVNLLIQKYYPELLKYLAKVLSPMQAHAKILKKTYPNAKIIFIGPCISKKEEANEYSDFVDCVLTFEELSTWLNEKHIDIVDHSDNENNSKARLFPVDGGIISTMKQAPEYNYFSISGTDECIQALNDIKLGNIKNCFIEMSSCKGSCIGGPVIKKHENTPVRNYLNVVNYAGKDDFIVDNYFKDEIHKEINYISRDVKLPGESEIRNILKQMGKNTALEELNCGCCGYSTCREKAIAVYQGKADLTMCLPYLKDRLESFSDNVLNHSPNGIIVLNNNLEIQKINKAALKIFNYQSDKDLLSLPLVTLIDPIDFMNVKMQEKVIKDKEVEYKEYGKIIEENIVYDKTYGIIIGILKDITKQKMIKSKKQFVDSKTIAAADEVVMKQMKVAQEIASLLGETVAETKSVLTNLKKQVESSKKDE